MKKIGLFLLISILISSPVLGQWQGVGIEQNPYKISSVKDLVNMVNKSLTENETFKDMYFELTDDIDLSPLSGKMRPIGTMQSPFRGYFNGVGHSISNLSFNTELPGYETALFGGVTGVIENLNLVDVDVKGGVMSLSVGALVGILNNGVVKGCSATGRVAGNKDVGGLVGNSLGTVADSYFIGEVSGTSQVGGLLGSLVGSINNCYFRGIVTENGAETANLVGKDKGMNSRGATVSKVTACNFTRDSGWAQADKEEAKASVVVKPLIAVIINNYDTDFKFCDGMLGVWNSELRGWGFINESGKLVIDYQWHFEPYMTPKFNSGYCAVFKSASNGVRAWHILDKSGHAVKVPGAVKISKFQDGFARAVIKSGQVYRHCYINTKGVQVFPSLSTTQNSYFGEDCLPPRSFCDGLAAFYSPTAQKYGFMNKSGAVIIKPVYEEVQDFSEGLAAVKTTATSTAPARFGYIDTKGAFVIPPKFSRSVLPFSEGFASVEKADGTVVMIDKTGNVVSPVYTDARQFHKGYAFVRLPGDLDMSVIDRDFNVVKRKTGFYRVNRTLEGFVPLRYIHDRVANDASSGGIFNHMGEKVSDGYKVGPFSDNLFHLRAKGKVSHKNGEVSVTWSASGGSELDVFADYEGNYVLVFVQSEF